MKISAVILAGGQGRRLNNQDKGLVELAGKPLIEHLIERIKPQVDSLAISANRNIETYKKYGLPVLGDSQQEYLGPLAGIEAAMCWCETEYLLTLPCDSPFIPDDLVSKMLAQLNKENSDVCLVHDGERLQPLISLISCSLYNELVNAIKRGHLKVEKWMLDQNYCVAEFSNPRLFTNINTAEDLSKAEIAMNKETT